VNDVGSGNTAYVGTVAFPSNWAALATTIAASQHVIVDSGLLTAGQWAKLASSIDGTPSGKVVTDPGNSATQIKTNLTEVTDDCYLNRYLLLTSGDMMGEVQPISGYNGTSKTMTTAAFTGTPADDVEFLVVGKTT
jgi:hypothetical protein